MATMNSGHAQAANASEPDAATLDKLVVVAESATTATKTDTALAGKPRQAISVVPSELFQARGAQNVQETLRYSAGATAEAFGLDTRSDVSSVRGLDPMQYLDGMRKIYNYSPIARYRCLHPRPGGTPARALVGALRRRQQRRHHQHHQQASAVLALGRCGLQYGSHDRAQLQVDLTGPLGEDGNLAGRVVGVARDSGMQTDVLQDDRQLLSPSLTWRPSDRSEVTFIGLFQRDETAPASSSCLWCRPCKEPVRAVWTRPRSSETRTTTASMHVRTRQQCSWSTALAMP
jgi:iron complex outermembrane receptor protein